MPRKPKTKTADPAHVPLITCTPALFPQLLELIADDNSLRAACRELNLHNSHTRAWIADDAGREAQYTRALELRAQAQHEELLAVGRAAATGEEIQLRGMTKKRAIDPAGARVLADVIKWSTARMAPKTAPRQQIDLNARIATMQDDELDAELASLGGGYAGSEG